MGNRVFGQAVDIIGALLVKGAITLSGAFNIFVGRANETAGGGGSVYARHFYGGGSIGGFHIYDGSTHAMYMTVDSQPVNMVLFQSNGANVCGLNVSNAAFQVFASGTSLYSLRFSDDDTGSGSGTYDGGFRVYASKGGTTAELWLDGTKVAAYFATGSANITAALIVGTTVNAKFFGQSQEFNIGTVGATATVDWSTNGASQRLTMTASTALTLTFSSPALIGWVTLKVIAPASGSIGVITWPATVKWPGATKKAPATTLGRSGIYRGYFDGTNYWMDCSQDMA